MTYNQLPETIISPITGDILTLQEEKPNDSELFVAKDCDTSTEYYDGNLAQYSNTLEDIYVKIDED